MSSHWRRIIIIYRIPPSTKNKLQKSTFIEELGDLLESTATLSGKLVILGDFNVHVDSNSDTESFQLSSPFSSFRMMQHVRDATHVDGHTLDLVASTKNKLQKSTFIEELGDLLESTATLSGKLVILGDFNVHVDSNSDTESFQLSSPFSSFRMMQHVRDATHVDGHTLDLVASHTTDDVVLSCEVGNFISDYNAVLLTLKSGKPHPTRKERKVRKIKSIVPAEFPNDILNSELTKPLPSHVNDMVFKYNDALLELLDKHAPTKLRRVVQRLPQPWMNAEILEAKRVRRRYERRWRRSPLTVYRQAFKASCEDVKKKIRESQSTYFRKQIDACGKDQPKLFKIVNNLLGRGKPSSLPEYTSWIMFFVPFLTVYLI